jgi:hypothetical protein
MNELSCSDDIHISLSSRHDHDSNESIAQGLSFQVFVPWHA